MKTGECPKNSRVLTFYLDFEFCHVNVDDYINILITGLKLLDKADVYKRAIRRFRITRKYL